jgi:hypothetical protein
MVHTLLCQVTLLQPQKLLLHIINETLLAFLFLQGWIPVGPVIINDLIRDHIPQLECLLLGCRTVTTIGFTCLTLHWLGLFLTDGVTGRVIRCIIVDSVIGISIICGGIFIIV